MSLCRRQLNKEIGEFNTRRLKIIPEKYRFKIAYGKYPFDLKNYTLEHEKWHNHIFGRYEYSIYKKRVDEEFDKGWNDWYNHCRWGY